MATIHFSSDLRSHTGGVDEIVVAAPRVHELLEAVVARFPDLAAVIGDLAVAVDGEIYQEAGYEDLRPDSEVHFVPRIAGG
jgi:molybdopterin converting factor small subunit